MFVNDEKVSLEIYINANNLVYLHLSEISKYSKLISGWGLDKSGGLDFSINNNKRVGVSIREVRVPIRLHIKSLSVSNFLNHFTAFFF